MRARAARCPIGGEKIDEIAARVNATIVVTILVSALITESPWMLGYLAVDYFVKLAFGFAYSPNCIIAKAVVNLLELQSSPIDSAPKRFAALLAGFMTTLALLMAYTIHSMFWFEVVLAMFICIASLDAFADFCLGCYLYALLPERVSAAIARR